MTAVIDDVVTSYSKNLDSHRSGWTRVLGQSMSAEFDGIKIAFDDSTAVLEADTWLVAHAMEFGGEVYNLFGGWSQEVKDRVSRLLEFEGNLVSLEMPMPNLREILEPRAVKTDINFTEAEWSKIQKVCCEDAEFHGGFPYANNVVLGDSHSVAQYRPGYQVLRHDGLTLHGLLNSHLINGMWGSHLIVVAGNIDIRHHFGRHDPYQAKSFAARLLFDLKNQLDQVVMRGYVDNYTVVTPYPVEYEGRRIPKTGWYKGTPFFMPREARAELVATWIDLAKEMFTVDQLFMWPEEWYQMDPEVYAKTRMEKPGSVHLSPRYHVTDYETGKPNDRLFS